MAKLNMDTLIADLIAAKLLDPSISIKIDGSPFIIKLDEMHPSNLRPLVTHGLRRKVQDGFTSRRAAAQKDDRQFNSRTTREELMDRHTEVDGWASDREAGFSLSDLDKERIALAEAEICRIASEKLGKDIKNRPSMAKEKLTAKYVHTSDKGVHRPNVSALMEWLEGGADKRYNITARAQSILDAGAPVESEEDDIDI